MSYRLYLGPATAEDLKPSERGGALFKEFRQLDDAIQFARHLERKDRVIEIAAPITGVPASLIPRSSSSA